MARYTSGRPRLGLPGGGAALGPLGAAGPASSNTGFLGPSAMPNGKRLAVSTPPARNTSPSPDLMAWAAMRMVMSEEEQ